MNENNERDKSDNNEISKDKTILGTHVWQLQNKESNFLLGTDVWQLQAEKVEAIKNHLPQNDKLDKIIQIAQILDKHQKEIDYYQSRIRGILAQITKLKSEKKARPEMKPTKLQEEEKKNQ